MGYLLLEMLTSSSMSLLYHWCALINELQLYDNIMSIQLSNCIWRKKFYLFFFLSKLRFLFDAFYVNIFFHYNETQLKFKKSQRVKNRYLVLALHFFNIWSIKVWLVLILTRNILELVFENVIFNGYLTNNLYNC